MENSRRDFIKKAALLAGATGALNTIPPSIRRAMAINPDPGTTFENAEHVVLLMQENRSFDHLYGTLQGVRGYNDPRAIRLPNKNLAWLQNNKKGETYAPFRLNIKETKATWMGSLPHSWESMVDARNNGRFDNWLEAKKSGHKDYQDMPLTMGHYGRDDLPFYYALADAFTVCDHHFCSSLTATSPNRLYFFSGTVREKPSGDSPANIHNSNVTYGSPAHWTTFPERLEKNGISWKVYQNELSLEVGLEGEEEDWLANFTNNDLEWFSQYHVRFHPAHVRYMQKRAKELKAEIPNYPKGDKERIKREKLLKRITKGLKKYTPENFKKLPEWQQEIHKKAFDTNVNDPYYHQLETLQYDDEGTERTMKIPRGDVLDQFRKDVQNGQLPSVSWLVAPCNFSDHPGAPWYGAWYVSEVLDILTRDPEVWKKTILILTYDENDGYFDHVPPFTAPNPEDTGSGKCSLGIDPTVDYVTETQAKALKGKPKDPRRVSPIGLGYRVPFVVASPWSRGGWVNSEVFDNTSVLMFLEKFISKSLGKQIKEDNISPWRRTICGDMTSVFRPYNGEEIRLPEFVKKKPFVESIYNAKFKSLPHGYKKLTNEEIKQINAAPGQSPLIPHQEPGIRSACPLPYQLYASGRIHPGRQTFELTMGAKNELPGAHAVGAPFTVYDLKDFATRNYAVRRGDTLSDNWAFQGSYHYDLYAPNGFFRSFKGDDKDPKLNILCEYERKRMNKGKFSGNIELKLELTQGQKEVVVIITDNAYNGKGITKGVTSGQSVSVPINLKRSHGWYDFTLHIKGNPDFERRFAGHVETGEASYTDPFMGQVEV